MFFASLPDINNDLGNDTWQEIRNKHSSFLLTEQDEGYRDVVTDTNEEFDHTGRKKIKPKYTKLERENFPVQGTTHSTNQQHVLEQYLKVSAIAMADLPLLYPQTTYKNTRESEDITLYGAARSAAGENRTLNPDNLSYFDVSTLAIPDVLKLNRYQDYGVDNMGLFLTISDEVITDIDFERLQLDRATDNLRTMNQYRFSYMDLSSSDGHVVVNQQVPMASLLLSMSNKKVSEKGMPSNWKGYSPASKKDIYAQALMQLSGEENLSPIMDSSKGVQLQPHSFPVFNEDGSGFSIGTFFSDSDDLLQRYDSCTEGDCTVSINTYIPWRQSMRRSQLFNMADDANPVEIETGAITFSSLPDRYKLTFSPTFMTRHQSLFSSSSKKGILYFYPHSSRENAPRKRKLAARFKLNASTQERTINLRHNIDPGRGQFILALTVRKTATKKRYTRFISISSDEVSQPARRHLGLEASLAPGEYYLQSGTNQQRVYFNVTSRNFSDPNISQPLPLPTEEPETLLSVKRRIEESNTNNSRYAEQWADIFAPIFELDSEAEPQSGAESQTIEGELDQYPIRFNQYQHILQPASDRPGIYQPYRIIGFTEGSRLYVDNMIRFMELCEEEEYTLPDELLRFLFVHTVPLPQQVMTDFFASFVSELKSSITARELINENGEN